MAKKRTVGKHDNIKCDNYMKRNFQTLYSEIFIEKYLIKMGRWKYGRFMLRINLQFQA
jgi:hypothetical protein